VSWPVVGAAMPWGVSTGQLWSCVWENPSANENDSSLQRDMWSLHPVVRNSMDRGTACALCISVS
jgi:hypothetical protein